MPRCEFKDPAFFNPNVFRGDETDQCWVSEAGNFGSEENPRYFCIFHAPQDQFPTDEPAWPTENVAHVQAEKLLELLKLWNSVNTKREKMVEEPLSFVLPHMQIGYFRFPKDFEFSGALNMNGAHFSDFADFSNAVFHGEISFTGSKFNEGIACNSSKFRQSADFSRCVFNGLSLFESAVFSKNEVSFSNCQFHDLAWFKSAFFEKAVNFSKSEFDKDADFSATFKETFDLGCVSIGGKAIFDHTIVEGDMRFGETRFADLVLMGHAHFAPKGLHLDLLLFTFRSIN